MSRVILDASAVLALIFRERGADVVAFHVPDGAISAVNIAEVVTKLADAGSSDESIRRTVIDLELDIVEFDEEMAIFSGLLRNEGRHIGLSLGDRACLALAKQEGLPALTADRAWAALDIGVEVRLIRGV